MLENCIHHKRFPERNSTRGIRTVTIPVSAAQSLALFSLLITVLNYLAKVKLQKKSVKKKKKRETRAGEA